MDKKNEKQNQTYKYKELMAARAGGEIGEKSEGD